MTTRIGVLGTGFIARYHAMQLSLADESNRIVAVYDPDLERARAFCEEYAGEPMGSIEEVVASSDAVFVCTWTSEHLRCVAAAVAAGRPIFCEKPLSTDLDGARELAAVVATSAAPNMVGLVLRSTPALLTLRELIRGGTHGRVMNVVFRDDQYLPTQGMYASTWRGDPALAGSGALLEHSIHDLDILEWLCGPVTTITAQQAYFHGLDGIEDSVSALLRFGSGATAALSSVWHDVLSRPSQRRVEVFCERALLTLEGEYFGPIRVQTSDDETVIDGDDTMSWLAANDIHPTSAEQEFLVATRRFLESGTAIRLDPDISDAVRAHVLADAVYRSAADGGTPVDVRTQD